MEAAATAGMGGESQWRSLPSLSRHPRLFPPQLLWTDIRVLARMMNMVLNGKTLSRRERRQFVRTAGDLFRLVPFSAFIIVPGTVVEREGSWRVCVCVCGSRGTNSAANRTPPLNFFFFSLPRPGTAAALCHQAVPQHVAVAVSRAKVHGRRGVSGRCLHSAVLPHRRAPNAQCPSCNLPLPLLAAGRPDAGRAARQA